MRVMETKGWSFAEGEEIAHDRFALTLLGGGRKFEVFLAWDEEMHTVVAVKLVRPELAEDEGTLDRFRAEAEALSRLQHPVLPRCFAQDISPPRPHIVLEFLDGPRLSTAIRRQRQLAVEQVLPLGVQLCAALHYMHGRDMVHLDVKPKNVILGAPARLVDLSIATSLGSARALTGPIGTDAYMAPEQCGVGMHEAIGPGTDVWGIGATLYEAITGRLPWPRGAGTEPGTARFPQLEVEPEALPRDIPRVVADPIEACLRRDPADRPNASELSAMLRPLADVLPRSPRVSRRRPRL